MDPWDKSGEEQRKEIILFKEERPKGDAILRGEELEVFYDLVERWKGWAKDLEEKIEDKKAYGFETEASVLNLKLSSIQKCISNLETTLENKANS